VFPLGENLFSCKGKFIFTGMKQKFPLHETEIFLVWNKVKLTTHLVFPAVNL